MPAGLLQAAILTGHVEKNSGGEWVLRNGILAGRWTMDALIRLMSYNIDAAAQRSLCADSNAFRQAKENFCRFMDIRVEGGHPSLPCDGMSMAYTFDADPAGMGAVVDSIPSPQTCTPENDPVTHGCGVP